MAFFGKNKKQSKNDSNNINANTASEKKDSENEIIVYRDGVFEVYKDKTTDKKYGRILKYHGSTKTFEISDEDFEMWRDASENFGKYRIQYDRDEDFFIEKASIELATIKEPYSETKETKAKEAQPAPELSEEDKEESRKLIEYYNTAVQSADFGKKMLETATLAESLCAAALCERKISELAAKARSTAKPGEKITVQLPVSLKNLSENAKKALFKNLPQADKLFVLCSEHTKRQHSAGGNALIAICEEAARAAENEFTKRNQKVYIRNIAPSEISREIADIAANGLRGIRFLYKFGMSALIQIDASQISQKLEYPENIPLRRYMTAFFQDLKNGVPQEKLKNTEAAMYDSLFRSVLLQPCSKKDGENGNTALTVSIVKDAGGNCFFDLYSSVQLMETSESYKKFKKDNPENSGYKKWQFDEILKEIASGNSSVNGFIIDKECIPVPFSGKSLERLLKIKEKWEENGKNFNSK